MTESAQRRATRRGQSAALEMGWLVVAAIKAGIVSSLVIAAVSVLLGAL